MKELFRGGGSCVSSSSSKVTYMCGILQNVSKSTVAAQLCADAVKGHWMILERSQCKYKEGVWARGHYLADHTGTAVLKSVTCSNGTSPRAKFRQILKSPNKPQNQTLTVGHRDRKATSGEALTVKWCSQRRRRGGPCSGCHSGLCCWSNQIQAPGSWGLHSPAGE